MNEILSCWQFVTKLYKLIYTNFLATILYILICKFIHVWIQICIQDTNCSIPICMLSDRQKNSQV
jgi:hypothetical protein